MPQLFVADSFGHTTAIRRWPWSVHRHAQPSPSGMFYVRFATGLHGAGGANSYLAL